MAGALLFCREKGLTLAPGLLFQKPTIAALAAELETGAPAAPQPEAAAVVPAEPESYKPTDFPDAEVSQRIWRLCCLNLGGWAGRGNPEEGWSHETFTGLGEYRL